MELAFGQYASLGPITVWKAAPIFKGQFHKADILLYLVVKYKIIIVAIILYSIWLSLLTYIVTILLFKNIANFKNNQTPSDPRK